MALRAPRGGALGVTHALSKPDQDSLNPKGVNCIRVLNDNVLVWGARTVGGDANADLKYVSVRRTLLFLRESIDEGTQWAVFEPNAPALWAKITRNITAFLTTVWRSGALFGSTLPDYVLDALSANITVIRSTTCFRIGDGTLLGWEGGFDHRGSCEGSCTAQTGGGSVLGAVIGAAGVGVVSILALRAMGEWRAGEKRTERY